MHLEWAQVCLQPDNQASLVTGKRMELNCWAQPQHEAVFELENGSTYGIGAFASRKAAFRL